MRFDRYFAIQSKLLVYTYVFHCVYKLTCKRGHQLQRHLFHGKSYTLKGNPKVEVLDYESICVRQCSYS